MMDIAPAEEGLRGDNAVEIRYTVAGDADLQRVGPDAPHVSLNQNPRLEPPKRKHGEENMGCDSVENVKATL